MEELSKDLDLQALLEATRNKYEYKQMAYRVMQNAWKKLQKARSSYNVEIDRLKTEMDEKYVYKEECFENARLCYQLKNYGRATELSSEGRNASKELTQIKRYRDNLILQKNNLDEIAIHASALNNYRSAKDEWALAKLLSDAKTAEAKKCNL